jgi:hypothetical protein
VHNAPQYISTPHRNFAKHAIMFWLIFEAGVALAVLLLIVWWTWPRAPRQKDQPPPDA